ncbi:Arc family DNA-binding protein [Mesorhizobium sp. M1399]|uniref:Arc family DNA-binding protein n=1 Tax=Mesorhizobium sp. M1399 TaxID=2957096 RepID=UPI00333772B1
MARSDPSFHVRLPAAMQKRLKMAAAENDRSINAEILARLERSLELDAADLGQALALLKQATVLLEKGSG